MEVQERRAISQVVHAACCLGRAFRFWTTTNGAACDWASEGFVRASPAFFIRLHMLEPGQHVLLPEWVM